MLMIMIMRNTQSATQMFYLHVAIEPHHNIQMTSDLDESNIRRNWHLRPAFCVRDGRLYILLQGLLEMCAKTLVHYFHMFEKQIQE